VDLKRKATATARMDLQRDETDGGKKGEFDMVVVRHSLDNGAVEEEDDYLDRYETTFSSDKMAVDGDSDSNDREKGGKNGRMMGSGSGTGIGMGMNGVKDSRSGGATGGTGVTGGGEEDWSHRDSGTCSPLTPPPSSNGNRGTGIDPKPNTVPTNPITNLDRYKGDGSGVRRDNMGNNNSTYLAALALNSNGRNNSNGNVSREGSGFIPDLPGVLTTVSTYEMYGQRGTLYFPYLHYIDLKKWNYTELYRFL
jgi:hypothetical protein